MSYLLDTHVILWWLSEPQKINEKARNVIRDRSHTIYLSSASFWEMAVKQSIGKLTLPHNLLETLTIEGFKSLPILPQEALGVADLPMIHQDPFDRLIIVQAKLHDLILITADEKIIQYPVSTLKA
ncbi:MAG: type II toxin-antitoxin system VapC family toxin [Gammaproteobacteria bacterium]